MRFKIVLKGLIVVENWGLGVDPFFAVSCKKIDFFGPKTHDANTMERKERSTRATDKLC